VHFCRQPPIFLQLDKTKKNHDFFHKYATKLSVRVSLEEQALEFTGRFLNASGLPGGTAVDLALKRTPAFTSRVNQQRQRPAIVLYLPSRLRIQIATAVIFVCPSL